MRKLYFGLTLLAGLIAVNATAGDSLLFRFDNAFNGSAPSGSAPWMTAEFTNIAPGCVILTLRTDGLVKGEKIGQVDLNLDSTLTAGVRDLRFTYLGGSRGIKAPSIDAHNNAFRVGHGGLFDIQLNFDVSNKHSFGPDEFVSIKISGLNCLTSDDFSALSAPTPGSGRFLSAVHVQGIPDGHHETTSGWISPTAEAVPEPGPAALAVVSCLLFVGLRRSRD